MQWVNVVLIVLAAGQSPAQEKVPSTSLGPPRTLVVTYSDGRTVSRLLNAKGGSITPRFPQQPDAPKYEGLSLSGLQIDHLVDSDVVVTVSLRYGSVYQKTVRVATVRLGGSEPVRVNELEAFGVDPVVLSVGDFPTRALVQPRGTSVSSLLDVSIELTQHDLPIYKVTFHNRSGRGVIAVTYTTFRGETETISGRRKNYRSTPLVDSAGEYVFTLQVGSGPTPGFDRFEVTAVLWDDGSVEGDSWLKDSEEALAVGQTQQLRRLLEILPASPRPHESTATRTTLSQIRAQIEALPIAVDDSDPVSTALSASGRQLWVESGQQQIKAAVLKDLDDYIRANPESNLGATLSWIASARGKYLEWLKTTTNMWPTSRRTSPK
jgi:hypothetical protein